MNSPKSPRTQSWSGTSEGDWVTKTGERFIRPRVWRQRNGTLIDIIVMDDQHLDNTIKMVERRFAPLLLYEMAAALSGEEPWAVRLPNGNGDDTVWRGICALRQERARRQLQYKMRGLGE